MAILIGLGVISVLIWLGVLLHPARPWDFQPVGDDEELPPAPSVWPSVCILVPARNESESLPHTLPALLIQDYPGEFAVVVIDDRSHDGTAEVAHALAEKCGATNRLAVISGAPLPSGWVGKVWALAQGAAHCGLNVGSESTDEILPVPPLSKEGTHMPPLEKGAARSAGGFGSVETGKRTFASNIDSEVDAQASHSSLRIPLPQYFLLTDADIHHGPHSLRRLVAESEIGHLALNSRMARLRCRSDAERWLIPPFVFFFNLLYPMRQVNDPRNAMAGAAGGCVLLQTSALERAGGFACIKDRIIDDVSLARQIKRADAPIQLALSRAEVESLRVYDSLDAIWVMVRRTAFTELRYSWLRLFGTVMGMGLMFIVPPLWTIGGAVMLLLGLLGAPAGGIASFTFITGLGACAWALMAIVYCPAVRFFHLPWAWCWTLPVAGVLYEGMTVDSAIRHATGRRIGWRDH